DVFNATDQLHKRTYTGNLDILWNSISLRRDNFFSGLQLKGIEVRNAVDVALRIARNRISGKKESGLLSFLENNDNQAGILLRNIDKGRLAIHSNSVTDRVYGVHAMRFTLTTFWDVDDLRTRGVKKAVFSEEVPNRYT
ncbi:MAG: hypothetical protein WD826_10725, partial [Actinomycetota bacterium]